MSWEREAKEDIELPLKEFISDKIFWPELFKLPERSWPVLSSLPLICAISLFIALFTVAFSAVSWLVISVPVTERAPLTSSMWSCK